MRLIAIEVGDRYYITVAPGDRWGRPDLNKYLFDGKKARPSFHRDWYIIDGIPTTVEGLIRQTSKRYELVDPSLASDMIPNTLDPGDVEGEDGEWLSEYVHLASLYEPVYEELPPLVEPVDFTFEVILEVEQLEPHSMSYQAAGRYGAFEITERDVTYQLLDKIMFPSIVLPMRPCKLTSRQAYQIVRQFVKQNIDYSVAEITSDYDFCFEVAKLVVLHDPYTVKHEVLTARGKSYKNPRYREVYVKERKITVFRMTWSPENYRDYPPIQEFVGENLEDLKRQIDEYCNELIDLINTPLVDCPTCGGMGVVEAHGGGL